MDNIIFSQHSIDALSERIAHRVSDQLSTKWQDPQFEPERLLTKEETAAFFNCHPNTIDNWRRTGQLKSIRVGQSVRFRQSDINDFLNRQA